MPLVYSTVPANWAEIEQGVFNYNEAYNVNINYTGDSPWGNDNLLDFDMLIIEFKLHLLLNVPLWIDTLSFFVAMC